MASVVALTVDRPTSISQSPSLSECAVLRRQPLGQFVTDCFLAVFVVSESMIEFDFVRGMLHL